MSLVIRRMGLVVALGAGAAGCGPIVDAEGSEDTTGQPGDGSGMSAGSQGSADGGSGVPPSTSIGTTEPFDPSDPGDTTVDGSDTNDSSLSFIGDPDLIVHPYECDVWGDDCPRGEKCMPWAYDGGSTWNATRCSPLAPDPRAPGEPCTVEGSAVSGIDDCEQHAMCWNVDPATNTGECIAMCSGSEANPLCEDACASCSSSGDGVLNLCLAGCDPLVSETCDADEVCAPSPSGHFFCAPHAPVGDSGIGAPCEFVNSCDAGLVCVAGATVPGCEESGCCAPFCDPAAEDTCDALLPGTTCVPWYDEWPGEGCTSAPPGVCGVPS